MHVGPGELFFSWTWLAGVGIILFLGLFLLPWFFFLLHLQNLLDQVSLANRGMSPGLVWLNFIPIFNLGWFIYTVIKVRDSVSAEFQSRGWLPDGDLGYNVGLTAGILWIAAAFIGWIPFIGWVLPLAGIVCWIIYWLKIVDLKHRLEGPPAWGRPGAYPYTYPPMVPPYGAPYPQPYVPPAAPGAPVLVPPAEAGTPPAGEPPAAEAAAVAGSEQPEAADEADGQEKDCGACGSKVDPDDKFCRTCGLPQPS